MSDAPSAKTPAGDSPAAAPPSKPRSSRVGRIVIAILLLVLAIEGFAAGRVYLAKSRLTGELARAEAENHIVTREEVKALLGGREPDVSRRIKVAVGEELYDLYYFRGLLKQRVLCVHYGVEGTQDVDESQREMMEVLTVVPEAVLFEEASNG